MGQYILFGLIPLNSPDSKEMAKGATDYTITTQQTFVDILRGHVPRVMAEMEFSTGLEEIRDPFF